VNVAFLDFNILFFLLQNPIPSSGTPGSSSIPSSSAAVGQPITPTTQQQTQQKMPTQISTPTQPQPKRKRPAIDEDFELPSSQMQLFTTRDSDEELLQCEGTVNRS